MLTANIIKHNQEQAIQLPHDVAFPEYIKQASGSDCGGQYTHLNARGRTFARVGAAAIAANR